MKWLFLLLPLILLAIPVHAETFATIDDSMINIAGGHATNYGTLTTIGTQSNYSAFFVKFNLSSLSGINISGITGVLSLYHEGNYGNGVGILKMYNVTSNWTEENITGDAQPLQSVLLSSTSDNFTVINTWDNFTINNATIQTSLAGDDILSLKIWINNSSIPAGPVYWSKEHGSLKPFLTVNYNVSDCNADCGDCGCLSGTQQCYIPPIVGAYATADSNTLTCVPYANCTGMASITCPNGTSSTQISPVYNFSNTGIFTAQNSSWCSGCYFVNLLQGWPAHWVNVLSNCPTKPECNCYGIYCSNNIYNSSNTSLPNIIPEWTAGCFNPSTGLYPIIWNSTCENTTIENITKTYCPDCDLTNETPTTCSVNTSTSCYDSSCNSVPCAIVVPTTCSSNTGGQLALSIGGLMGITDCGLAQNILAILTSIIIGFAIMFYTKESEHSGQAFIFGTISMLVMFTLIGWFASWLMVILIVIGGYLVAKSLGLGGG